MSKYTTKKLTGKYFDCYICDKNVYKSPSEIKKVSDGRITCSRECTLEKISERNMKVIEDRLGIDDLKSWLNKKYHVERLTTREMALMAYGKKHFSPNILGWMKKLNISSRGRSEAVAMQWENNPERRKETGRVMSVSTAMGSEGRRKLIEHMQTDEYRLKCSVVKRGNKNPMWNEHLTAGDRQGRSGKGMNKRWVNAVKDRDNHTCKVCGTHGVTVVAHHLNGYHWDVENRYNVDNGKTLCEPCHKEFHRLFGNRENTKEQFKEHKQNIIDKEFKQLTLI